MSMEFFAPESIPEQELQRAILALRTHDRWVFVKKESSAVPDFPSVEREKGVSLKKTAEQLACSLLDSSSEKPTAISAFRENGISGMLYLLCTERTPEKQTGEILLSPDCPAGGAGHLKELFECAQIWLNMQTNIDELWDLYDQDFHLTGKTQRRGQMIPKGMQHMTVQVWLQNTDGRFLITRRAPNKGYTYFWECPGGSALAGEDSLTAALREMREEAGIVLDPSCGTRVLRQKGQNMCSNDWFTDVWLFRQSFSLKDVILQPGETCDARCVTALEVEQLFLTKEFVPFYYLESFLNTLKTCGQNSRSPVLSE